MKQEKEHNKAFEYKESELRDAIEVIRKSDHPESLKKLIIRCLEASIGINALILRHKTLKRILRRFFGFKTEKTQKKSPRVKKQILPAKKKTPKNLKDMEEEDTKS